MIRMDQLSKISGATPSSAVPEPVPSAMVKSERAKSLIRELDAGLEGERGTQRKTGLG